jgi:hypothetical protein
MKAFGLVGRWSTDCAGDSRRIWAMPLMGNSTVIDISYGDNGFAARQTWIVLSAVRVTEEKIKVTTKWVRLEEKWGDEEWKDNDRFTKNSTNIAVYEKTGNKIHLVLPTRNGATWEKCIN